MKKIKLLILTLVFTMLCASAIFAQSQSAVWKNFQAAVANGEKEKIADLTKFPFSSPKYEKDLSREDFIKNFDEIFNERMKRQISAGKLMYVTKADIAAEKKEGFEPCYKIGDYVVIPINETAWDNGEKVEVFLRLTFRKRNGQMKLDRIIGCS